MVHNKREHGLSLVELMIALALSLFIVGATIHMYVGTRQTERLNNEISRLQENGRFALQILTQDIRLAGYQGPGQTGVVPGHFFHDSCGSYSPCTQDGGSVESDRIAVQLNPPPDDGSETDCTGAAVAANDTIANVYYLSSSGDSTSLTCRGYDVSGNSWNGPAQAVISGVDNLQIQYGLAPGGDGVRSYVSADRVSDWSEVAAVRIALLVDSGLADGHGQDSSRDYVLLDAGKLSFNDRKVRQIFSTTVEIHNR